MKIIIVNFRPAAKVTTEPYTIFDFWLECFNQVFPERKWTATVYKFERRDVR